MNLFQALNYPFQGRNWPRRVLLLALLQLVPLFGQLLLLGYGMEVVKAVYAGETELPPVRWLPDFGNGLRLLVIGLVLLAPILGFIPTIAAFGTTNGNLNVVGLLLSGVVLLFLIVIAVGLLVGAVRQAIENKGLLQPNTTVKILLKNRATSSLLVLNLLVLGIVTLLVTACGLVLLIVPGLLMLVTGSLAGWYLVANYGLEVGIGQVATTVPVK